MEKDKTEDNAMGRLSDMRDVSSGESEVTGMILGEIVRLSKASDLVRAIGEMLERIGGYLKAERMYLFEERGDFYPNTHEWCAPGIRPEKAAMQNLTREDLSYWLRTMETGEGIFVSDVETFRKSRPEADALLARQGIHSMTAAPILIENRLVGFLGVDNSPYEITPLIMDSLTVLGAFIGTLWHVQQRKENIERQNRELKREKVMCRDALLNQCEYCYSFDLTKGVIKEQFVAANGVNIFETLGLSVPVSFDELNRKYLSAFGVKFLDEEHEKNFCCEGLLAQFARGNTNVDSEYYSTKTDSYYRATALLSEDEVDGHIWAVIFSTNTTKWRKKEQKSVEELIEAKEAVSRMNEELQEALDSEREKTAVIGALSNIYYSSYLIDLCGETITEISSSGYLERYAGAVNSVKEAFQSWIGKGPEEEFREEVGKFLDVSTIPERMKDTRILSYECIRKEKGWIRMSFIAADWDDEGAVSQVLLVVQQINEEKKIELAQQKALETACDAANRANAAKTNFLASMSHDIRTPMNAIIGMTAIAGTHLDDKERVADCLGKITVSSKHLLGLINEVLDMNKIESGKLDLHDEDFSLSELIDNLLSMVRPQIDSKNHELVVTIHGIEHERVVGDSQRLQQVFMNLMSNAVKYTPEGGTIRLTITEKPTNKPKIGCYEFIFEDNGIGMSEEFLDQLFNPFARAADSRVEKIQGSGLGMAITYNMVQMMNGNVEVESKLNQGTKVTVTIVMKLQDDDEKIAYEEFVDLPILVADDDEIACETTCEVLEELGMKGEWVLSGQEAVEVVVCRHEENRDFFAVIVDWKMPGMDGIQTTKEIRRRVGNEVPVIIISAYDWSDIELEARAAGANAFISKPLFKSRMAHLFKGLLGGDVSEEHRTSLDDIISNDFEGRRALLVEDNDLNAEIAGEILEMAGLEVEYAKDGKEALDKMVTVKDDYYDIVFMDIQMPVMNGYDATVAIRALPGEYTKRVPIIAMTANAFTEDVRASHRAGMNQHIAKPLDFDQLMQTLCKWLK